MTLGETPGDPVPVVDIGGWSSAHDRDRRRIAGEVDRACSELGFLQVVGHGVPRASIDAMLAACDRFFALPLEDKLTCLPPGPEVNRGFAPLGSESLRYSLGEAAPPDLFEAFNMGRDRVDLTDPAVLAERHRIFAPNIWPEALPGMRAPLVSYFDEVADLARRLTRIFAVALGMDEEFFVDHCTHSTETLRMVRYEREPGSPDPLPEQMRMGAHTDYGIVTVLHADPVAGLQVLGPDEAWLDVVPRPGAYLVNVGDLLAEWTNDRWRSTLHRVVPPPAGADGPVLRRSAAFFLDGNHDALVECLPTCCDRSNPARYPPVLAGEHLLAKLVGPRTGTASVRYVDTLGGRSAD